MWKIFLKRSLLLIGCFMYPLFQLLMLAAIFQGLKEICALAFICQVLTFYLMFGLHASKLDA